jgi:hypothetical protein
MARRLCNSRKMNMLVVRNFSLRQWEYLKARSDVESAKAGRYVGLSEVLAKIVSGAMRGDVFF